MKRITTGIEKLDKLVQGGIPEKSVIGVSGPAGIGKSIMALQYILEGAKNNEKCLYINLEEPEENINRTVTSLSFGENFFKYRKKGLINVMCLNYQEFEKVYPEVFSKIEKDKKLKRVVIDSFNCYFSYLNLEKNTSQKIGYERRKIISESFNLFRKKDFTTLLVLENGSEHNYDLNNYVYYMVDGIIHLDFISLGSIERRVFIPKMRWTKQYPSSLPFTISKKGIIINIKY